MTTHNLRVNTGPWCGAVTSSSAVVKATVMRNVQAARLLVATDPTLASDGAYHPGTLWEDPDGDYKAKLVSFPVSGLQANTDYHFALELDGVVQLARPGRLRTFPVEGERADFTFAFGSCSSNALLFGAFLSPEAFAIIPQEPNLLFFFHLGDFYYDIKSRRVGRRIEKYDWVMHRPEMAGFFSRLPFAYCWDDHDFLGNNTQGGKESTRLAARAALEAYGLYMPHYALPDGADGIYQSFVVGRVLFLLTDTRFHRSAQGTPEGPAKTILGVNQKAWLKDHLRRAGDYDLVVWANSIPWVGEADPGKDYWAGYATERAELANFVKTEKVRNLCMISGDAHMLAIDDGLHSGFAEPDEQGDRGGFPVFHAAALESIPTEKGGPYSIGNEDHTRDWGIAGTRQYGTFEVRYAKDADGRATGAPRVYWEGKRARDGAKSLADVEVLLRHDFPAEETFYSF